MNKINIIFINGVGSVGKTSIANALQDILDEPYLHIGVDHFFIMLPKKYLPGGSQAIDGVDFEHPTINHCFSQAFTNKRFASHIFSGIIC